MKLIKLVENGNVFAKWHPVLFATREYLNIWRALIRLVQRSDTDKPQLAEPHHLPRLTNPLM
jgi:hypothetical protein